MQARPKQCYLCGEGIEADHSSGRRGRTVDHVPPKQFYPKHLWSTHPLNLWTLPAHASCNQSYQDDEDYFYHALYPLVDKLNPEGGKEILRDLSRRAAKPQTPAIAQELLQTVSQVTKGGLFLPAGIAQYEVDKYRLERIAIKIGRGVVYHNTGEIVLPEGCKDIRLCEGPEAVPELYRLSWRLSAIKTVHEAVFSYKLYQLDELLLVSMLFWGAIMFCCALDLNSQEIELPADADVAPPSENEVDSDKTPRA